MKKTLLGSLLLLLLVACQSTTDETAGSDKNSMFHTTDPSRLYFKNVRSVNYETLASPQEGVEVFRLRRLVPEDDRPMLIPTILNNWMEDEAYVFLETNQYQAEFARPLQLKWVVAADTGLLQLERPTPLDQRRLADTLYSLLEQQADFFIKTKEADYLPLWKDNADRTAFAATLRDYYRLVERD